jgi:hypothetical protein
MGLDMACTKISPQSKKSYFLSSTESCASVISLNNSQSQTCWKSSKKKAQTQASRGAAFQEEVIDHEMAWAAARSGVSYSAQQVDQGIQLLFSVVKYLALHLRTWDEFAIRCHFHLL